MYKPTAKQAEAWKLAREGARNILFVGGSRSGKTTLFVEEILCRAIYYPGSRHLLARLKFSHAKSSLWMDTIPKVLELEGVKREELRISESDHFIQFPNGSEIWVDGLDDKERVEKILGREYATILFNECSQIPHDSVETVLTRLAQNVPGCINKAFFDLNPVGRLHWTYKMFIQKIQPATDEPLPQPEASDSIYIQPDDNRENLPDGYIEDVLGALPEHKKRRFRYGEWGEPEGVIFQNWDIIEKIPDEVKRRGKRSHGLDFGFSVDPAAVIDIYKYGDELYLDEILYEKNRTNPHLTMILKSKNLPNKIYADSAEPKSIEELRRSGINIVGAAKGQDSIRQGIDWLLSQKIYVTRRSGNLQMELQSYTWEFDRSGEMRPKPIDDFNHLIDALRYGCEPYMRKPGEIKSTPVRGLI